MVTDRLLATKEAAGILGMTPNALRHCLRRGQIPGVKMGRKWMLKDSELSAYIASLQSSWSAHQPNSRLREER